MPTDPSLGRVRLLFEPGRLGQARLARGMKMVDLAEKVGVTPAAIGQYEAGHIKPSAEVLGRLATALEVDQPQLRATLAASTLIGMAMLRYVIKLEPLASARPEVVARWLGPAVQRYLTDPDVTARRTEPTIEPMPPAAQVSLSEQLSKIPPGVRSTVKAAIKKVQAAAPEADEIAYRSQQPRSKSAMWKLVRYAVDGTNVVGIGTFSNHSTLFFYRGRELDDGSGLLQGSGKDSRFVTLRSPADVERPAVKRLVRNAFRLE